MDWKNLWVAADVYRCSTHWVQPLHLTPFPTTTKKKTILDGGMLIVLVTGDFFPILCIPPPAFPSRRSTDSSSLEDKHSTCPEPEGQVPQWDRIYPNFSCPPRGAVQGCGLLSAGLTATLPLNHFSSATSSSAISSPPGKAGRSPGQGRCYEPRDTGGKEKLLAEMGMVF